MKVLPAALANMMMQTRSTEDDRERQQILFPTSDGKKKVLFPDGDDIIEFPK